MNTVFNDNCLDILPTLKDQSVDLVITDPPYFINYFTNRRKDKNHKFCKPIEGDNDPSILKPLFHELNRILKNNSAIYVFCSPDTVELFKNEMEKYFKIKNIIIWDKGNWAAGDLKAQYGKSYEMIIYANKGRRFINGKRLSDIWTFPRVVGKRQLHQNQKPIPLIEQMVEKSSKEGDLILDPFAGSGTTGIACLNQKRDSILIEMNEQIFDIMKWRLNEKT